VKGYAAQETTSHGDAKARSALMAQRPTDKMAATVFGFRAEPLVGDLRRIIRMLNRTKFPCAYKMSWQARRTESPRTPQLQNPVQD